LNQNRIFSISLYNHQICPTDTLLDLADNVLPPSSSGTPSSFPARYRVFLKPLFWLQKHWQRAAGVMKDRSHAETVSRQRETSSHAPVAGFSI
jgi:hypothetical protein